MRARALARTVNWINFNLWILTSIIRACSRYGEWGSSFARPVDGLPSKRSPWRWCQASHLVWRRSVQVLLVWLLSMWSIYQHKSWYRYTCLAMSARRMLHRWPEQLFMVLFCVYLCRPLFEDPWRQAETRVSGSDLSLLLLTYMHTTLLLKGVVLSVSGMKRVGAKGTVGMRENSYTIWKSWFVNLTGGFPGEERDFTGVPRPSNRYTYPSRWVLHHLIVICVGWRNNHQCSPEATQHWHQYHCHGGLWTIFLPLEMHFNC